MPIPPLKKRSYGYIKENPKENNQTSHQKHPNRDWLNWIGFTVVLPFRLIGFILRPFIWFTSLILRGKKRRKQLLWIGIWGAGIIIIAMALTVVWTGKNLPDPNKLTDRQFAQSTKIYDRTGQELLYEIFTDQKRTLVELNEIPQYLIDGVIATEDKKFYEHRGIRPLSIIRALIYGIFTNKKVAGTSTLTQQLVKNAILTNERTMTRKIKEIVLSIRLEQKYTKDQILKIYFNEIPYGSTNYGVESAAQSYFGKHVSNITLAEAATLVGLPQKPSVYLNNLDALKTRRNFVLQRMVEEGNLDKAKAETAKQEPLILKRQLTDIKAPHFVLYVKEQLVEKYGENTVEKGGLKVITSLDWKKQEIAEMAMAETGAKLLEQGGANNAALLALDPKTGQILAMVGSKNYFDDAIDGQYDVVRLARRQPGSSIKPIIYAAAFEKGYTPNTILYDVVTPFVGVNGNAYVPKNYDLKEHGPVTMRSALQGSLNISAVKTFYLVGFKKGIEFAERMGYTTFSAGNFGLSLVLGGGGVSLMEHVRAYTIFADNGKKHPVVSILKVSDPESDVLYEWKPDKGESVIDSKLAATISNILSDDDARAFVFGAGSNLTIPGRPVAAKSGTTNNYVDAWVVGYTPSLVAGVWAGNTDNSPMKAGFGGTKIAGQIWNYFMKESLKNTPVEKFPDPPIINTAKPVLNGSTSGEMKALVDEVTGKLATSSTPAKYIVEKSFISPHSILHYVDKNNPQGPALENPIIDPYYETWEKAIQDWIVRRKEEDPEWNVSFEAPPTEYDDIHTLELIPTLEVVYPQSNSILTSRQIDSDIRVSAPRGVKKVSYKIDSAYVAVVNRYPFNLNYYAKKIDPGAHTLTIIVEDDVGNKLSEKIPFTLDVPETPPALYFNKAPQSVSEVDFPVVMFFDPYKLDQIKEVSVKAINLENKTTLTILNQDDFSDLFNNQIIATWKKKPANGIWRVAASVTLKTGEVKESDSREIEIKM